MSNNSASYILILIVLGMFFLAGTASAGDVQIEALFDVQLTSQYASPIDLSGGAVSDNFTATLTSPYVGDNFTWTVHYPNTSTIDFHTGYAQDNLTLNVNAPGPYSVHVVAYNGTGGSNTADASVIATQPIRGTIELVGNVTSFNQTFLYVMDNYSATPDTFTWYFGDNLTNQTGISPTHKFNYTPYYLPGDNYTVMVTASNVSYSTFNLTNVSQKNVQINPPPFTNFTIQDSASGDNISKGPRPLVVDLYGNVTTYDGTEAPVLGYNWFDGITTLDNLDKPFNTVGQYDLWLNSSTRYGSNVSHHTLMVYDNITANFTSTPPSCPAFPVNMNFTDTSTGSIVNNRTWNFGDNSTIVTTNSDTISHVYYSPINAKVTLSAHNQTFNIDNVTTHDVEVTGLYANFTVTPPWTQTIDRGSPATFTFDPTSSVGVDNTTNYIWDFTREDGTTIQNMSVNPSFSWFKNGTYNVSLTVLGGAPCHASNTSKKQVRVVENLKTGIDYTPKYGAFPLNVTFFDTSTDTPNTWIYTFYNLNGTVNETSHDVTNPRASHWYMEPGYYHVRLDNSNGGNNDHKDLFFTLVTGLSANFTAVPTIGVYPLSVQFMDNSTPAGWATNWSWDFGDGTSNSTSNPLKTYSRNGTFNVALTVTNQSTGMSDSKQVTNYIDVGSPIHAAYYNTTSTGLLPLTVNFIDQSSGDADSWNWTFDSGITKSGKTVNMTYFSTGIYDITLNVSSSKYGSSNVTTGKVFINQASTPISDFSFQPKTGMAPLLVNFTDQTLGSPTSWLWDFGDGYHSTNQSPSHLFQSGGKNFMVNLTASNQYGAGTTATQEIFVSEAVKAAFMATPSAGIAPLTVQFTDQSAGSPDLWAWNFGDGNTSTVHNPDHTFYSAGTYHVVLNATNTYTRLSDQTYMDLKVSNVTPADVDFDVIGQYTGKKPLTVHFNDTTSVGFRPTSWYWDFGDGSNSFNQNPTHQFVNEGMFTVTLTVKNEAGVNDKTRVVYVVVMG